MKAIKNFFILSLFVHLISSCRDCEIEKNKKLSVHEPAKINYLIYMAADNNLERFALKNIDEMKNSFISDDINVIVLLDRSPGFDKTHNKWTGTKLFKISCAENLEDDLLLDFDELDMTDSSNLLEFLNLSESYFPADITILNIWSHDKGVYPDCKIPFSKNTISRSLIEDYTSSYDSYMSILDFSSVLKSYFEKTGKRIDILQFDCCFMQMLEVLYELKDYVKICLGPQCEVPGAGSNYKDLNKESDIAFTDTRFSSAFSKLIEFTLYYVAEEPISPVSVFLFYPAV